MDLRLGQGVVHLIDRPLLTKAAHNVLIAPKLNPRDLQPEDEEKQEIQDNQEAQPNHPQDEPQHQLQEVWYPGLELGPKPFG